MATRSLVGAYTYRTQRGTPASGQLTLASDPRPGYANVLYLSLTDKHGNDRSDAVEAIAEGDALAILTDSGSFPSVVVGVPDPQATYVGFPVTVRLAFDTDDEPPQNTDALVVRDVASLWPTTAELAQVLDIDNIAAWQTTLDRVMSTAIDVTKGQVGYWDDASMVPDDNLSAAALRMAELMSLRPDATVAALTRDAAFRAHMSGKHRKFGVA